MRASQHHCRPLCRTFVSHLVARTCAVWGSVRVRAVRVSTDTPALDWPTGAMGVDGAAVGFSSLPAAAAAAAPVVAAGTALGFPAGVFTGGLSLSNSRDSSKELSMSSSSDAFRDGGRVLLAPPLPLPLPLPAAAAAPPVAAFRDAGKLLSREESSPCRSPSSMPKSDAVNSGRREPGVVADVAAAAPPPPPLVADGPVVATAGFAAAAAAAAVLVVVSCAGFAPVSTLAAPAFAAAPVALALLLLFDPTLPPLVPLGAAAVLAFGFCFFAFSS